LATPSAAGRSPGKIEKMIKTVYETKETKDRLLAANISAPHYWRFYKNQGTYETHPQNVQNFFYCVGWGTPICLPPFQQEMCHEEQQGKITRSVFYFALFQLVTNLAAGTYQV
jgi:hypothetical protein